MVFVRAACGLGGLFFTANDFENMKPLFIPLKAEFFDAFQAGSKNKEYRRYGARWNEKTCPIGRPVILSRGYGKAARLAGLVTSFEVSTKPTKTRAWKACYGSRRSKAAIIGIEVLW